MGNENRPDIKPDWNVRYFRPYRPVDRDAWRLTVDGLVETPRSLSVNDIMELPRTRKSVRMKCVECWSARADWTGFVYPVLADLVRPKADAAWLRIECADGYYESISVEGLSSLKVLFAHQMDGEALLPEFGAPLRLVVPSKYGYKWPKAITRLRFEEEERRGYWSSVGPYSAHGRVRAGIDYPLDLGESREIEGGAITEY